MFYHYPNAEKNYNIVIRITLKIIKTQISRIIDRVIDLSIIIYVIFYVSYKLLIDEDSSTRISYRKIMLSPLPESSENILTHSWP